jgi:branched-subunit amino acid transport protein
MFPEFTSTQGVLAILGMALVTFAIKAGGLILADRLPRTGFFALWLKHIPGAVLAALVAPAVLTGRLADALAGIATAALFLLTRNLFAAMAGGVITVYFARMLLAG